MARRFKRRKEGASVLCEMASAADKRYRQPMGCPDRLPRPGVSEKPVNGFIPGFCLMSLSFNAKCIIAIVEAVASCWKDEQLTLRARYFLCFNASDLQPRTLNTSSQFTTGRSRLHSVVCHTTLSNRILPKMLRADLLAELIGILGQHAR